jgi:peptide/nickel transport system substrate-binding protein
MRAARNLWLVTALAIVAAACATGDPEAQRDAAEPAQRELAAEQTLVVGAPEDGYDVEGPRANVGMYPQNANIFEGLVRMTPDYEIEPVLATEWEFVEPNTWRFTLREDITFHDGQPFDAEAAKFTLDRIAEAGGGTLQVDENSAKVIDEFTLEVTPKVENRRLVEQLVHPQNSMVAPGTDPGKEPVGTGPFRFVSYEQEQQLVVERNDDYWGEAPTLDRITFRFIPEANARRLTLESGDVDVMLEVPLEAASTLEAAGFVIDEPPVGITTAMYANISGEKGYTTLQDERVRKAVSYAINRDALIEGVFDGRASPEQTFTPARLLGPENAKKIEGYDHDPERSGQLLEEAGWTLGDDGMRSKDGKRLALQLINGFPSAQVHGSVPEFIQAQLGQVGIDVEIVTTPDSGSYEERLNSFEGDLWLERGSQNDANPAFFPALLFWEQGLFGNIGYQPLFAPSWPVDEEVDRVGDGTFDELIVKALASPDSEEVKALTAEAMHLLIDEYAIVIPLAGLSRLNAHTENVQNFESHPSGLQVRYDDVSIAAG